MKGRAPLVLLALLLLLAAAGVQQVVLARRASFRAEDDSLFLPRASALRAMSLGHTELAADLVFIRAIIYFGSQFQTKGEYRWLDKYLDTIVTLDPRFKTPYRWAGVASIYNGREITQAAVMASNHFLEMGVEQFPDEWEFPFMLGCNYLFEMHTDDPQQKKRWQVTGGEWVRRAALLQGAPPWVPLLAATIMKQEGKEEAAVRHLEEVYVATQDEKTRQEIFNRLMGMKTRLDLKKSEREKKEFAEAYKANLPYGPADLFVILGKKPSARMDLEWLMHDEVLHGEKETGNGEPGTGN